jgi:hypothetical protein
MARNRWLAAAVLGVALAAAHSAFAFQLITSDEAKLPSAQVVQIATRGLTRGPTVDQVSPPPDATVPSGGSVTFDITFDAHNGATINPSTVKVTYMKQPAIDLTQRLKPFITPKGIDAANVQIPAGTHMIRIEVTDSEGRSTTEIMKIQVAAN